MPAKTFPIGVILNFADGRLFTSMDDVYTFANFMTGDNLFTLWPWDRDAQYCTASQARGVGARNLRPDGAGIALVCDWPKHLLP